MCDFSNAITGMSEGIKETIDQRGLELIEEKAKQEHHDHHELCKSSRGLAIGSVRCTCKELFARDEKVKQYDLFIEKFIQLYGKETLEAFLQFVEDEEEKEDET